MDTKANILDTLAIRGDESYARLRPIIQENQKLYDGSWINVNCDSFLYSLEY